MVRAELPGMGAEDINLSVKGNVLTLSGTRQTVELPENAWYHRDECASGNFSRTIRLPFNADADKVDASYEKGILIVNLVSTAADKPHKIDIKSN